MLGFLLFLVGSVGLTQEMNSFCFTGAVNLKAVRQSLEVILLPKDILENREEDNCLDIISTPERAALFQKFLSKRYQLKNDLTSKLNEDNECRLEFKTTKNINSEADGFNLGKKNKAENSRGIQKSTTTMEMLLGAGFPGELEAYNLKLKVICQKIPHQDSVNLTFSFVEKDKANINTQVLLKKGEWLNIASVAKNLSEKLNTISTSKIELGRMTENAETIYEIKYK